MEKPKKRKRGRPTVKKWPEQIPDTPENIAKAILFTSPETLKDLIEIERKGAKKKE